METQRICPNCQKPLGPDVPMGLCPECLVKAGFPTGAETETGTNSQRFVPPAIAELAPKFPQLEILELIGHGGMGAVYKARQKQLDRIVALKILPPGIGGDPAFAERFAREAKALAKLNHPGIVTIYDFGRADGLFYFFMEYVDGVNLRQLLHADRVSAREALAIVPQICDALQFAHDQGIVHRDIKPENILMDRRGRVKVADFGLAKIIEPGRADLPVSRENGAAQQHGPTGVMGTPQYMSPEQVHAPGEVDHRADIYALGVVFYQMLTGELPGKKIEPPSRKVQIDVRLDEVVLRALEKKPELRYQQVSVLKTQLETIATTPGSSRGNEAHTETPKTPPSIEADEANSIVRQVVGAGSFLALMAFGMGINITPFQPFGVAIVAWGVLLSVIAAAMATTAGNSLIKLKLAGSLVLINGIGLFSVVIPLALDCPWMRRTDTHILVIAASGCAIIFSLKKLFNTWSFTNHALHSTPGSSRGNEAQTKKTGSPSILASAASHQESRFSRTAIVGAVLAVLIVPTLLLGRLTFATPSLSSERMGAWMSLMFFGLVLLSATAPVATTILGWIAVLQIRRSAGKLHGLWLAVFDGLFFPLLVLDAIVFVPVYSTVLLIAKLPFFDHSADGGGNAVGYQITLLNLICIGGTVLISGALDWFIVCRVWRAVNKSIALEKNNPVPEVETWLAGIDSGKYSQSWDTAAAYFQRALTREKWVLELEKVRHPLGQMNSRKLVFMKFSAGASRFEAKFATAFDGLPKALETVTFQLEGDGNWRAIGYFIHPQNNAPGWKIAFWSVLAVLLLTTGINATINLVTAQYKNHSHKETAASTVFQLSFGPVVERVLTNDTMIDFDSGTVVTNLPESVTQLNSIAGSVLAAFDWMHQNGLDFITIEGDGIFSVDMKMKPLPADDWEHLLPAQMAGQLAGVKPISGQIKIPTNAPACYVFQTREGGMGILQVTNLTGNPRDVKLRYKLVQHITAKPVASTPTPDIPAHTIVFLGVQCSQVLDVYAQLTEATLEMDSRVRTLPATITYTNITPLTRAEAVQQLESVLRDQAGVVASHRDAKHISLRYCGLEFRRVAAEVDPQAPAELLPDASDATQQRTLRVLNEVLLDESAVESAGYTVNQPDQKNISVTLTPRGAERFAELTKANVGRQLAIVWHGRVICAPRIQSAITGGRVQITGRFTDAEAQQLLGVLNHRQKIISIPRPTPVPPPPAASATRLSFGPVIVRAIQSGETKTNLFLNLDTGELLTPPENLRRLFREDYSTRNDWESHDDPRALKMREWLRSSGANLMVRDGGRGSEELEIREAAAFPPNVISNDVVVPFGFDQADANYLGTRLQRMLESLEKQRQSHKTIWMLQPGFDPRLNARQDSFCFKTAKGAVGILQILNAEDNPAGVRVRYKLVKNGDEEKNVVLPESKGGTARMESPPPSNAVNLVTGKITDDTGKPLSGIRWRVSAIEEWQNGQWTLLHNSGWPECGFSDTAGRFEINFSGKRRYDLQFDGGEFAPKFLYRVPFDATNLIVMMNPGIPIHGTVNQTGPVLTPANVRVELRLPCRDFWYQTETITDENGHFQFFVGAPPVEPGRSFPAKWQIVCAGSVLPVDVSTEKSIRVHLDVDVKGKAVGEQIK